MVVAKKVIARFKFSVIAFIICWSPDVYSQEYILTTSAANIISAKALIDLPVLSGKTGAIIVATPTGNTKTSNPHPTGAWYYSGQWNLFNCDFAPLIVGLTYKIQYFPVPGPNQFMHTVTTQNLGAEGSYIDNPSLNNHPNAQFIIFQNHEPDLRGSWLNAFETKTGYSTATAKWYIVNVGGQILPKGAAYNIVITPPVSANPGTNGTPLDNTNNNNGNTYNTTAPTCKCPVSLPPNGLAGGDLAGTYPDPTVRKILGRPLSSTVPQIGQLLKWNGTEWAPANDNIGGNLPVTNNLFNNTIELNSTTRIGISQVNPTLVPGLTYTLTVVTNAKLLVSFNLSTYTDLCFGCVASAANLNLFLDNVDTGTYSWDIPNNSHTQLGGSRLLSIPAGTHTIELRASVFSGPAMYFSNDWSKVNNMIIQIILP